MESKIAAKMLLKSVEIGFKMVPGGSKIAGCPGRLEREGSEVAFGRKAKHRRLYSGFRGFWALQGTFWGPLGQEGSGPLWGASWAVWSALRWLLGGIDW